MKLNITKNICSYTDDVSRYQS